MENRLTPTERWLQERWVPTHDHSGKPIAEMSAYELRRRLAIARENPEDHPISNGYRRAYEAALAEREGR